jgi:alpha-1,2-mannosyltransferase
VLIIATAAHKSGDLPLELAQAERLLSGQPLYKESAELGLWWPPFTALLLAPFAWVARMSLPLAKALWAVLGVGCVAWSVVVIGRRWGWLAALIPLAVLSRAIHNNFEHGQITALLLAFVVAALVELDRGRMRHGGAWIGAAAASKAFPGLLLVWVLLRGRWRAALAGTIAAGVLTVGAMLPYGPLDAVTAVRDWVVLSQQAPGTAGFAMQKLGKLIRGWGGGITTIIMVHVLLVALTAWTFGRRGRPIGALYEGGIVILLAVLLSPIGWFYYFGLLLPAGAAAVHHLPRQDRRAWIAALGLAALLLSGFPALLVPDHLSALVQNGDTAGALVLLCALLAMKWRRSP